MLRGGRILWRVLIPGFYSPVRQLVGCSYCQTCVDQRPQLCLAICHSPFTWPLFCSSVTNPLLKDSEQIGSGLRQAFPRVHPLPHHEVSMVTWKRFFSKGVPETGGSILTRACSTWAMMGTHPWWFPLLPLLSLTPSSICKSLSMRSEFSRSLIQTAGHRLTSVAGSWGKEKNKDRTMSPHDAEWVQFVAPDSGRCSDCFSGIKTAVSSLL